MFVGTNIVARIQTPKCLDLNGCLANNAPLDYWLGRWFFRPKDTDRYRGGVLALGRCGNLLPKALPGELCIWRSAEPGGLRAIGEVWSSRHPVTVEIAGSNPV